MLSLSSLLTLPLVAAVLGSAVVSVVLCLTHFFRPRQSLPSLHYRESALNSRLLSRCGLRHRVFSPAFWMTSSHVQTVLAACWPRGGDGQEVTFQREYLQMRDKGVVALDWATTVQPRVKRKATVLLVLPPVTGDAHSVSTLCELATKRGFRTVVFNPRGHGNSVLTTAKLLNAADPSDMRQVVKYLRQRFPKSRLAAVAHGTGCGLLISYLGEFGSSALLSAGTCVSPCYDTVEKFSGPLRSLYDLAHLLRLKWILLQHAKALSAVVDVKKAVLKAWSFRAYEEAVYCRMYNYASRSDSALRGTHSSVGVNGVATPSGGGAFSSSSVDGNGNGGSRCADGFISGGVSHAAAVAANGNVKMQTSAVVTVPSPQSVSSSSSLNSDTVSKTSKVSSRLVSKVPMSNLSPHLASSTLTPKPSHPVTEGLRQPSSETSPHPHPRSSSLSQGSALEEYWEHNNPIRDVDDIAVPVLCINSLDDPFFITTTTNTTSTSSSSSSSSPSSSFSSPSFSSSSSSSSASSSSTTTTTTIPYDMFRCYPNFLLVVTEGGGHCGFLERYPFRTSWADLLCLDYLEAVFELTTRGYVSCATTTNTSTTNTSNSASSTKVSGASSVSSSNSRRNTRSTI
ncbi:hypothetical protein ACOMHN_059502 [Nucella lapillus]